MGGDTPKEDKIKIISEIVSTNDDEFLTFYDFNVEPIDYEVDNYNEIAHIEMLYPLDVGVYYYGGKYYNEDYGNSFITYQDLPNETLSEIFDIVVEYYINNQ